MFPNAVRQGAREFGLGLVVEQGQRLQGRIGAIPAGDAFLRDRRVEQHESGMRRRPDEVGVHTTPEPILPLVCLPVPVDLSELSGTLGLWRIYAWSAYGRCQQSGRRERRVADDFRFQAEAVLAGKQAVARIDGGRIGAIGRRLPVGGRVQDQTVNVLEVPATADELRREPVEQLWVAGWIALRAKIVLGLYDPQTEIALPESVHGDPGRERVVVGYEPPRQP